jgi:hypothetical protein
MAAETPQERAKDIKRSLSCLRCVLLGLTDACFALQIQSIVPAVLLDLSRVIGRDRYETKYRSDISADISLSVLGPPYLPDMSIWT